MHTRVVKLGGSLLTQAKLVPALSAWIEAQSPSAQTLVIVGGGEIVDAVRTLDQQSPLPPDQAHWLCIDLLRVTFRYTAQLFTQWQTIESTDELQSLLARPRPGTNLVAVDAFYRRETPADWPKKWQTASEMLPHDWRTTSDALAALLAVHAQAIELVLLKSCEVPQADIQELARRGIVDDAITRLADRIPEIRVQRLPLESQVEPRDI